MKTDNHFLMRRFALLGLLALALHLAGPLLPGASASAPDTIEVCTAHGLVEIAPDGAPATPVAGAGHCDLCACHGMAANAAPAATKIAAPRLAAAVPRPRGIDSPFPATASRPRAPPLAS